MLTILLNCMRMMAYLIAIYSSIEKRTERYALFLYGGMCMNKKIAIVGLLSLSLVGCNKEVFKSIENIEETKVSNQVDNVIENRCLELEMLADSDDRVKLNDTYLKYVLEAEEEKDKEKYRNVVYKYYESAVKIKYGQINREEKVENVQDYFIGYTALKIHKPLSITLEDIHKLEKSKDNYKEAVKAEESKDIDVAIAKYGLVIDKDINYDTSQNKIEELNTLKENNKIAFIKGLAESGKYDKAIEEANSLDSKNKEEMLKIIEDTKKLKEYKESITASIKEDYASKNYIELNKHFKEIDEKYGYDSAVAKFGNKLKADMETDEKAYLNEALNFLYYLTSNDDNTLVENEDDRNSLISKINDSIQLINKYKCTTENTKDIMPIIDSLCSNAIILLSNSNDSIEEINRKAVDLVIRANDIQPKVIELLDNN